MKRRFFTAERKLRRSFFPGLLFGCAVSALSCSDPEQERAKATTIPTYDKATGKLQRLTADANKNGTIDTWMDMEGAKCLRLERDTDEDDRVDYWETYLDGGKMLDTTARDENGDGAPDKWEQYKQGTVSQVEWDDNFDGSRDRRWTYGADGQLEWIESDPDGHGGYRKKVKAARL